MGECCNAVLELGYMDGTKVYFVVCQKSKGHRGRHFNKERIRKKSGMIEYSIYWRKVKRSGKCLKK